MYGINGFVIKRDKSKNPVEMLHTMNERIFHRGADSEGTFTKELESSIVGMGMRRLTIIDLSSASQIIFNDDKSKVIVYNGEIYNSRDIRKELEQQHHLCFSTQSDGEVLLKGYSVWGEKILSKLNGVFILSIYDDNKKEIFIARDRLGEKPLYYTFEDDAFVWASELKSISTLLPKKGEISQEALNIYFSLSYIPAPYTIYKDVKKLSAGHYMRVNVETLHSSIVRYWDIPVGTNPNPIKTYAQAKQKLRELLFDAIEKRITDVPFGTFLSGGVDSGIVSAIAAKISGQSIKTFSVGFKNKRYDESERAMIVAKHINSEHHEFILDYDEILGDVDSIILNYDEPYADASCIPTYFISKQASEKVKMVLSGDGGDEVFGGYNKYLFIRYRKMFNRYLPAFVRKLLISEFFSQQFLGKGDTRSFSAKFKKLLTSIDSDVINSHLNIISLGFKNRELSQLLSKQPLSSNELLLDNIDMNVLSKLTDDLKLVRYLDKETSLEGDMLVKTDRACILASLICRSPLLDYRLMEFSYTIPDEYLLYKSNKKRILKDTFADLLPDNYFNAPKLGFEIPVGEWFRTSLKTDLYETLSAKNMECCNFLNVQYIGQLVDEHITGKFDHATKLWIVYCFQKWYDKYM